MAEQEATAHCALHVTDALLPLAEAAVGGDFLLATQVIHVAVLLQAQILHGSAFNPL